MAEWVCKNVNVITRTNFSYMFANLIYDNKSIKLTEHVTAIYNSDYTEDDIILDATQLIQTKLDSLNYTKEDNSVSVNFDS